VASSGARTREGALETASVGGATLVGGVLFGAELELEHPARAAAPTIIATIMRARFIAPSCLSQEPSLVPLTQQGVRPGDDGEAGVIQPVDFVGALPDSPRPGKSRPILHAAPTHVQNVSHEGAVNVTPMVLIEALPVHLVLRVVAELEGQLEAGEGHSGSDVDHGACHSLPPAPPRRLRRAECSAHAI
jgi:hypothetical protein